MSATCTTIREHDGRVTLANGRLRLDFDLHNHGALIAIVDPASGADLIRDPDAPRLLWRLGLRRQGSPDLEWLRSDQAGLVSHQLARTETGATLTLTCTGLPASVAEVIVRVSLDDDSALSAWRVEVRGVDAEVAVCEITCPLISGLIRMGDPAPGEALVSPVQSEGYLYRNPYPVQDGRPQCAGPGPEANVDGIGRAGGRYPGTIALQMLALYNDQSGLYFAAHDAGQHPKDIVMGAFTDLGGTPVMSLTHLCSELAGQDYVLPYDAVVGVFQGDWYHAADIYKAWATQQWWCEHKLWDRDIAEWLRTGVGGVFQMSNYHIPELKLNHSLDLIADTVNEVSAAAGVPLLALLFNWERGGAWTGPDGFFPPREGEDAFRKAMTKLRAAGNLGFVYITGGCWYLKLPYDPPFDSWPAFEAEGRPAAIRDVTGEVPVGRWYAGWESTRLCAYPEYTRDLTASILLGCLDIGCSVVQIDNFPCSGAESCYDPTHGHPLGYGPWWAEAWGETLAATRRRARAADQTCAITTEGISEGFIPWLDLYDQRAGNMEYFGHYGAGLPCGGETIPLFGYVYNEYIGAYYAAMPECNRPEVLYWTRGIGKAICQGVLPAAGRYFPDPPEHNPVTLAFYERVARAAGRELYPYLMFGEMLRPPEVTSPQFTAEYYKFVLDERGHYVDPDQRHEVTDHAVQHAAYRGRDGSVCLLFVNVSDQPVEFPVTLLAYEFAGSVNVQRITNSEPHDWLAAVPLPHTASLAMEPFSIDLLIMREASA